MRRVAVRTLAVLALTAASAAAFGYWYLRQSLPVVSGTIAVPGLTGVVEIVRDRDAVPHVFAATKSDALFGLGYVHAQDRLWQMEFQRRIGHGRLSEIFGPATLAQDRFLRTVGFGRAAASAWRSLLPDARRDIDAYVAGVNAFLAGRRGRHLPPEFTLLGFEPEPWSGVDVLAWVKMMAWDLSANYSSELLRHDLAAAVGDDRLAALMRPYPTDGLNILGTGGMPMRAGAGSSGKVTFGRAVAGLVPAPLRRGRLSGDRVDVSAQPATGRPWSVALAETIAQGHPGVRDLLLGGAMTEALGSNNWVVDGTMTATGKPLLANDPHLGTHVPSLWYLAHLSAGAFDVIGATLPGAPAVAIGRNRRIAWGETNVAADVQDLYVERLDASGTAAEFKGRMEPLRMISENIHVKNGEPVRITVRLSRHGPLVSDAIDAGRETAPGVPAPDPRQALAFRWTALDEEDQTVAAFLKLNEAQSWAEFTAALELLVAPAQNFVYADVDGHIGYYLPGRVPIRASGDGSRPTPGWSGESEWTGWIPFADLPHAFDPPSHFIVTANHRPEAEGGPLIGLEYPEPYRAQRITDLLAGRRELTPDDFRDIQADTLSLHARELLPILLPLVEPESDRDRQLLDLLRRWPHDTKGDSAEAAVFEAWFLELAPHLAGDDLGPRLTDRYGGRFSYITRFASQTLTDSQSAWCDDVTTPVRETCRATVSRAFHAALQSLDTHLGTDPRRWRWDAVHRAVFPHQGLETVPVLGPFLSRSMPNGGDWATVNVGPVAADRPYEQRSVPGYRQIVDLSPADDSRFLDAVGQSGHVFSSRYDDFLHDWHAVRHRPMRRDRQTIEREAIGTLRLVPVR